MPQTAHHPATGEPESPLKKSSPTPPASSADAPDNAPTQPAGKGALFRALVEAGAGAVVAYTAAEGAESMASESAAAQVQPVLAEIRLFTTRMDERFAAVERKLDALTEVAANHDKKLDVLAARMDALKSEMRLMWGALGILITVQIAILGFLLAR